MVFVKVDYAYNISVVVSTHAYFCVLQFQKSRLSIFYKPMHFFLAKASYHSNDMLYPLFVLVFIMFKLTSAVSMYCYI